ncbi:MAG: helix-turn-helix domain-containing protein [Eubacteriales bacterium]|nr:helix-turn-helix domain-containing protein [Eubacteriales bacterium]
MEYITTKEASEKWGISTTRITVLANEGRIPGAHRLGKSWLIPASATKPAELKPNHSKSAKKETDNFSFPLYHFRPDWSYIKEDQLSEQQKRLLLAETATYECRFEDVYPILEPVLQAPDDIVTEIGGLCIYGICCITLNKPENFLKIYLRLQMLLSKDFPHQDDLSLIFDLLNTYVETMVSVANNDVYNTDVNDQCLPLLCLLIGYTQLTKEIIEPNAADTSMLELLLRFLQTTSAIIAVEMIHLYLLGIYSLRQNMADAEKHARFAIQIAYENKLYFPLITYYHYNTHILSPILQEYPKNFQKHCTELSEKYKTNFVSFFNSITEHSVVSLLTDANVPYIHAVIMGLTNTHIAEKLGVSQQTVKRKIERLCENVGVNNKKELKEYLERYI